MSTSNSESEFQQQLERVYQQHRNKSLESDLDELAEKMEETMLQRELAEQLLRTELEIDSEAKQNVQKAINLVEKDEYEALRELLPEVRTTVERQATQTENTIHSLRLDKLDTVRAMVRLNERVERASGPQLRALEKLLDDWNWGSHVYSDGHDSFVERREAARQFGSDMSAFFESTQEKLFEPYGGQLRPLIEQLLDDDPLMLAKLEEDELEALAESDLAEYLELSFA
ncbi:hypothetical protein AUR64_03840 [Haloprofundus marisrubri]|uniref:Uncharacterized protein n=1 Tax=Haloprofundus marisrubri TaxID=1514971 RepID=A0A0W1RCG4_9EURY|nr:hypothetical protein [Haloprofundus marisrubri]KTG11397.1 hypothetical protein AUR64_03840 [Haloprofundus marisrubri]